MNTEQFIRDATRGLSRRKRAEAQAELRSHLHERTHQLILLGQPLPLAQAQAMQELGAPGVIARGLRRTEHVHPLLSAAALTVLAGVLLWPLPILRWEQMLSQVQVATTSSNPEELRERSSLPVAEARQKLESVGIQLMRENGVYLLRHAGLPDAVMGNTFWCVVPGMPDQTQPTLPALLSGELPTFVDMDSLVGCMAQAHWPLTVSPTGISLQRQELPLHWGGNLSAARLLLQPYIPALTDTLKQLPPAMWRTSWSGPTVIPLATEEVNPLPALKVSLPPQTPVLVVVKSQTRWVGKDKRKPEPIFRAAVRWTDERGQLAVPQPLNDQKLKLYGSREDWVGAPATENAAMLLRVTAQANREIELRPLPIPSE